MDEQKEKMSAIHAAMKQNFAKKATFDWALDSYFMFRNYIWKLFSDIVYKAKAEDWSANPIKDLKTLAYYVYHTARIEDIVCNTLICGTGQIMFADEFDERLNSPIITTGNELDGEQIVEFSEQIDVKQLQLYYQNVFVHTNDVVAKLTFEDMREKVTDENRLELIQSKSVSSDESAFWLVDYWCGKTVAGLVEMPFTRHQMLHLYNCVTILKKLKRW